MTREWSMEFSVEILGLVTSVKCLMASLKFLASKSAADGLHQLSSHGAESFMELWKIDVFSWKHGDARFQHVDVQMSIANGSGRRSDEFVYLDTGSPWVFEPTLGSPFYRYKTVFYQIGANPG